MKELKDLHRKGRPITEITQVNIEGLKYDPWCTQGETEA